MGVRWGWGRPPLWGRSGVPLFPWDPPMCRPPPPNPVCPPPRSPLTLGGGHCGRPCCHPPHCTGAPPLPHSPPRLGCSSRGGTTAPAPTGSPPAGDTHTVTPWRGAGSHGRYRGDPSGEVPGAGGGWGAGRCHSQPGLPAAPCGGAARRLGWGGLWAGPSFGGPPRDPRSAAAASAAPPAAGTGGHVMRWRGEWTQMPRDPSPPTPLKTPGTLRPLQDPPRDPWAQPGHP